LAPQLGQTNRNGKAQVSVPVCTHVFPGVSSSGNAAVGIEHGRSDIEQVQCRVIQIAYSRRGYPLRAKAERRSLAIYLEAE